MISTRKSREELVICLCFEKESPGDIFIHELASGNIFGDAQPLNLILNGPDRSGLESLCMEIEDCSFPLVRQTCVVPSLSELTATPDVAMVLLSNSPTDRSIHSNTKEVSRLIDFVSMIGDELKCFPAVDSVQFVIVGDHALTASSLMSESLPTLNSSQFLAFDSLEMASKSNKKMRSSRNRSQYRLVSHLCEALSQWWSGPKISSQATVVLGTRFEEVHSRSAASNSQTGYFFSTPVTIHGPKSLSVCAQQSGELAEQMQQRKTEQDQAIKLMQVNKGQKLCDGTIFDVNSRSML